jgi:adenosylcobyric acid synthase
MKRCLVVWGCTSGAGKSLLATALCRWAANRGLDVAPFKAQNMSNNARVVAAAAAAAGIGQDTGVAIDDGTGGEIGAAQYFQALAARQPPEVDMNPVLLKPEADTRSQVVVNGRVDESLSRQGWRERSGRLAEIARAGFERLAARHEVIVVEGAGSPAETNLAPQDYVNLGVVRWAQAAGGSGAAVQALLVADIDRGGAFAHALGTWMLLPEDLRPHLAGFVLNKFRGDESLLAPAPEQLRQATGVPVLGVLPMWREHGLPDEDGLFDEARGEVLADVRSDVRSDVLGDVLGDLLADAPARSLGAASFGTSAPRLVIAIVAGPHISNLDEFQPLRRLPGVVLRWVRTPQGLAGADWIVLPGSKQVSGDLAWLRATHLDTAIAAHAARGGNVLGICGGAQMLGATLEDRDGADGEAHGPRPGLGLLPLVTRYERPKRVRPTRAAFDTTLEGGPWAALSGLSFDSYEIRCGRTEFAAAEADAQVVLRADDGHAIGWSQGPVLALLAHGLFDAAAVQRALFGAVGPSLDDRFDALAAWLEERLGAATLQRLFGL